jgi:hypothetical protein
MSAYHRFWFGIRHLHLVAQYLPDALADLRALLSLYLPFVTIEFDIMLDRNDAISQANLHYSAISASMKAFKIFWNNSRIHAEHVVFAYTTMNGLEPLEYPYLVFVRQTTRAHRINGREIPLRRARYVARYYYAKSPEVPSLSDDRKLERIHQELSRQRGIEQLERLITEWRKTNGAKDPKYCHGNVGRV